MIDLSTVPNVDAATGNRINGEARDDVVPGDNSGTPVREDWEQDGHYSLIAVMNRAGISADNSEEGALTSQVLTALEKIIDGIDDRVINVVANKTILATEEADRYSVDTASGSIVVTLPDRASVNGKRIRINYTQQTSTNIVTVTRAGSDTITGDALTTIILPKEQNYLELYADSNSGRWEIINENIACQWRGDTHAGYGGGSFTFIPYLTNVRENYGNLFTVVNDGTEGLTFTINKSGFYTFTYESFADGSDRMFGMSEGTSQGGTSIAAINIQDVRGRTQATTGRPDTVTWCGWLNAGVDIRPHNGGAFTPDTNRSSFTASYGK